MTLVPLTIIVPLLAATFLAATRAVANRVFAEIVSLGASLAVLVMCAILIKRAAGETVVYWWGAWEPRGEIALGVDFAFGPIGAGMAAFSAALMVAAFVFSWRFLETVADLFHVVMLVFLAALVGFSLSGDLFNMFVFFELMSVSAYVLAGFLIGLLLRRR